MNWLRSGPGLCVSHGGRSGAARSAPGLAVAGELGAHAVELVVGQDVGRPEVGELRGVPVLGGEGLDLGGELERQANPRLTLSEAITILQGQRISPLPSESTIKREFARVDARMGYARKVAAATTAEIVELPFAGGELLLAAELETSGIAALTDEVVAMGEVATVASEGQVPEKDVAHRDARGHFMVTYNRRRRRKQGEEVASYLRSAAEKAEARVPSWPRFVHEQRPTIEAKMRMLVLAWMVAGSKGWDSLRAPEVAGLEALSGFAYMPSTLAKFVSALAISGAHK
jgi:hypothetical protein